MADDDHPQLRSPSSSKQKVHVDDKNVSLSVGKKQQQLLSFMTQQEHRKPRSVPLDEQSRGAQSSVSRLRRSKVPSGRRKGADQTDTAIPGEPSAGVDPNDSAPHGRTKRTTRAKHTFQATSVIANDNLVSKRRQESETQSTAAMHTDTGKQTYQITGTKEEMIELLKALVEEGKGNDKNEDDSKVDKKDLGGFLKERKIRTRVPGEARSVMTSIIESKTTQEAEGTPQNREDTMTLLHDLASIAPIRKKRGSEKGSATAEPDDATARPHRTKKTLVRTKHTSLTPKASKGNVRMSGVPVSPGINKSPSGHNAGRRSSGNSTGKSPGGNSTGRRSSENSSGSGPRKIRIPKSPRNSYGSGSGGSMSPRKSPKDSSEEKTLKRHSKDSTSRHKSSSSPSSSLGHSSSSSLSHKGHSSSSKTSSSSRHSSGSHRKSSRRDRSSGNSKSRHSENSRRKVSTIPEDGKLSPLDMLSDPDAPPGTPKISNMSKVIQDEGEIRKISKHLRRSSLSSASFASAINMDVPPPLLSLNSSSSTPSDTPKLKPSKKTVPTVEWDVFSAYIWAAGKQSKREIFEQRQQLRNSIRDNPLYTAFHRME